MNLETLSTKWHPLGLFYRTEGTPSFKFLTQALIYRNSNVVLFLSMKIRKNNPSKVEYSSKISKIVTAALAAQVAQKAESCTTRSCVLQDWVFRLGFWPKMLLLFFSRIA